jgi:hypothetical protein
MAIAEFGHLVIIIAALLYMASYVGLGVRLEQMISVGRAPKRSQASSACSAHSRPSASSSVASIVTSATPRSPR